MKKRFFSLACSLLSGLAAGMVLLGAVAFADETALFTTSVSPDALIVLDLSGSMDWNPAGGDNTWGNSTCSGTFYSSSGTGHTTRCSRLDIAKRAIFDLLDDNGNGTIDSQDEGSLGVRVGYMRYYNCGSNDTGGSYSAGCNSLVWAINSRYSRIYCNNATSCTSASSSSGSVNGESASGGTPLASALNEAKLYLDANKAADAAGACRQKFAILITDGADTFACTGNGTETQSDMYKRRRESVAKAKALADAGYKVFVIGFGAGMPDYLEKTLNWMAYYGKTDNPLTANSGSTSGYDPAAVASCQDSSTTTVGGVTYAASNDPGNTSLAGYAFLAADASQLADSLKTAMNIIREANYAFSQSSIQSSRTADENFIYEGSFQPITGDPFWLGHLKKFTVNADGTVGAASATWGSAGDAGAILQSTAASARTMMKTYKAGNLISFTTANITAADLGVTTTAERDAVVGYIRGETAYNDDAWKLGDVFRSAPITVGTPSAFYSDSRDTNNAFAQFRADHPRTSALGNRIIIAGANDGQLHAFKTSNGTEAWSFIPPNELPRLKNIAHAAHPTLLAHSYFVDGPVTVADVWLGAGSGTSKDVADWQTVMVFGEGRGSVGTSWSSSASCDSGFSPVYSATYQYYCGYYAFNLTDPLNPVYKWRLTTTAAQSPYLGDSWSKVMTGRVLIGGNERWVGFFGAGYNAGDCSGGGGCDTRGKGFFVVDLKDGTILWSYTKGGTDTPTTSANMNYSLPGTPAIADTDNDGFVDTAYIGDLGGSMWRMKMCLTADGTTCGTTNWTGSRFFGSSTGTIRPIYTLPAVAKDGDNNLWVYWGTGDKTDPTAANAQEKFFGVKDNDRVATYGLGDLDNITSSTYNPTSTRPGWYMNIPGGGEKILADPSVFGGVVYFTTFKPASGGSDPCNQGGDSLLYAVMATTGAGIILPDGTGVIGGTGSTGGTGGAGDIIPTGGVSGTGVTGVVAGTGATVVGERSTQIGTGIASAPVISIGPGAMSADLYVTTSSGAESAARTQRMNFNPPGMSNRTNMLFWRDQRLQ